MGLYTSDGSIRVHHPLEDGDIVNIKGLTIEAFAVPGHSKGCSAYLINGVLFMGDSAHGKEGGTIREAIWFLSEDIDRNRASLRKLANRLKPRAGEIKAMAFGHTGHLEGARALFDFAEGE